ncbi:unnamed protein product [Brassica rapa]|uniref:Uncharacterized protein n=1 Tax=Brassica campestris TaxID=3711 RepID=A0A8D9LT07_BRACM|nr:unnamed protein product [Brassica rapa]
MCSIWYCRHIVNSTKTYLGLGNSRDELSAVIRALDILQAVASNPAVFGYSEENKIVPRSVRKHDDKELLLELMATLTRGRESY